MTKKHRDELPPLGEELYEHYPSMSAQEHERHVKQYARLAMAKNPTPAPRADG